MDDDERPDPDCPDCFGTGESIGFDEDGAAVWYPCGCLTEREPDWGTDDWRDVWIPLGRER